MAWAQICSIHVQSGILVDDVDLTRDHNRNPQNTKQNKNCKAFVCIKSSTVSYKLDNNDAAWVLDVLVLIGFYLL